jgi:hypothetical protein
MPLIPLNRTNLSFPFHELYYVLQTHGVSSSLSTTPTQVSWSILFADVFLCLNSDILSKLDGIPMRRTPTVRLCGNRYLDRDSMDPLPQSTSPEELNLRIEREYNIDGTSRSMTAHSSEYYFSWILWLRARLNRIISEMYTTNQAYCKPQNVTSIITGTHRSLNFGTGLFRWTYNLSAR